MNTNLLASPVARRHRRHTSEFKAQVIAACMQPGVSIAAVALANQLNANFLRSWVKAYRNQQRDGLPANISTAESDDAGICPPPTLIPVKVEATDAKAADDIQIEIRRQQTVFQIAWPISQATACAQWLREILR